MNLKDMPNSAAKDPNAPVVHQQLGEMARQLHDTLAQLGFMPKLGELTDSLPDARSRLSYIAVKTAEAADKVLNSVDQAKAEHSRIAKDTQDLAEAVVANPVRAVASGAVINFVTDIEAATARVDQHLTPIDLGQDPRMNHVLWRTDAHYGPLFHDQNTITVLTCQIDVV